MQSGGSVTWAIGTALNIPASLKDRNGNDATAAWTIGGGATPTSVILGGTTGEITGTPAGNISDKGQFIVIATGTGIWSSLVNSFQINWSLTAPHG
jgi:hypothetical protein